ncbi:SU10 major capsid protein [Candidatus Poriferisocius sp.]|uniref:SU10 major capsid protein n=1 Tax=Candidatus Poriferisocius sp. TaxID=3101276 RepID=UPI003B528392
MALTTKRAAAALPSQAIVGLREDLSDQIYNVDPTGFHFLENAPRGPAPNALVYEWQLDEDETVKTASTPNTSGSDNHYDSAVVEGHIPNFRIEPQPLRIANTVQIQEESLKETETVRVVNKAGRRDEFGRRMEKKIRNLKRRMEYSLWRRGYPVLPGSNWTTRNPTAVPSDTGGPNDEISGTETIRKFAGIKAFLRSNVDTSLTSGHTMPKLTTGLPVDPPDAVSGDKETLITANGATRPFHEKMLNDLLDKTFENIDENMTFQAYMNVFNRRKWSRMAGIVDVQKNLGSEMKSVMIGSADVYMDEMYTVIGNVSRHIDPEDMAFMRWEHLDICYMRPMGGRELPSIGDYRAWFINVEWGFRVYNEKNLAWIGKLTTS